MSFKIFYTAHLQKYLNSEFTLTPNGSYALLSESRLKFEVDIPTSYVPQNFFCAKLFSNIEILVNHTSLSYKSSENDHSLSVYFSTKINAEEINLATTGSLDGYWSNNELGSISFYDNLLPKDDSTAIGKIRRHHPEVKLREQGSTDRSVTLESGTVNFKRYRFIHQLQFPLAQRPHPLPKDCNVRIIFYRAKWYKSVISVHLNNQKQDIGGFKDAVIPMINPVLEIKYAESSKYDKRYATHKISRVKFPFLSKTIRRELLHNGIANFKIPIAQGNLPIAICFAFSEPDLFDGSVLKPITNFKPYNLQSFDLILDARSISGYPLKTYENNVSEFYFHFLEQCHFWKNSYSTGPMSYDTYRKQNFIVVDNLKRRGLNNGQLTLALQFKSILDRNYILIIMPIYQQMLEFDEHLTAQMRSGSAVEADRADHE